MKLAVVGSRDFPHLWMVDQYLDREVSDNELIIVSGGAKGVDSWAERWANYFEIRTKIFFPDWDKYGKSAGFKRNIHIVDYADQVVAFQFNESMGTQHTINLAKEAGKLRDVISVIR